MLIRLVFWVIFVRRRELAMAQATWQGPPKLPSRGRLPWLRSTGIGRCSRTKCCGHDFLSLVSALRMPAQHRGRSGFLWQSGASACTA
ncbi:unnamed protein product, partial [Amoebophrya sp. A120]|eukprot:GSA120T00022203001.1